MNWSPLTLQDLQAIKAAALIEALRTSALAEDETDPMDSIIVNVTARIRSEIAACSGRSLDADTTALPTSLKNLAARMVLREMSSRLQLALTKEEQEEQTQDLHLLERIASGEFYIETPDNPIAVDMPRIAARCSKWKSEQQEGV